jgi:hypothetical protein
MSLDLHYALPQLPFHFTRTSVSWLNAIEGFFETLGFLSTTSLGGRSRIFQSRTRRLLMM